MKPYNHIAIRPLLELLDGVEDASETAPVEKTAAKSGKKTAKGRVAPTSSRSRSDGRTARRKNPSSQHG